jgi:hypothetical protein
MINKVNFMNKMTYHKYMKKLKMRKIIRKTKNIIIKMMKIKYKFRYINLMIFRKKIYYNIIFKNRMGRIFKSNKY